MTSGRTATNIELQLFLLALVATVLYAFFSTGIHSLGVLLIPPPFLTVGYGVLLLWGLPLWRRLYLKRSPAAALVLVVIGVLLFLICQYSFFVWVIAFGAAGISP